MEHIHVAVVGKAIYLQQKNPLKIFERLFLKHLKSKIHCCLDTRKLWRMHPLQKHPEAIAEARSGEGSSWILRTIIYRPKRSDPIIAVRCCDMQHRSSSGNYSVTFSFPCLHLWFPTQHKQLPSVSCIDGEELRRTVTRSNDLCCVMTLTKLRWWWLNTGRGDQSPTQGRRLRLAIPGPAPQPQTGLER